MTKESQEPVNKPVTPDIPPVPPIVATPKVLDEPVMVRTLQDTVQPSAKKEDAQIEAAKLKSGGQRVVNNVWEGMQAIIAFMVTSTGMWVAGSLALRSGVTAEDKAASFAAVVFITGAANLVIGFYFGRTNHQRTGGVGGENEVSGR